MSAGKADGGISREPLVANRIIKGASASKFARDDMSGSKTQSPYKNKGKAADLNII